MSTSGMSDRTGSESERQSSIGRAGETDDTVEGFDDESTPRTLTSRTPPAGQGYQGDEFLDASEPPNEGGYERSNRMSSSTSGGMGGQSGTPGRDPSRQMGQELAHVERIERRTSTLENWDGEGGAMPSGPIPEGYSQQANLGGGSGEGGSGQGGSGQGGSGQGDVRVYGQESGQGFSRGYQQGGYQQGGYQQGGYAGGSFGLDRGERNAAIGSGARPGVNEHTYPPNRMRPVVVGNSERLLLTAAGGALTFYGLRNPTPGRLLLGLLGMGLVYQGATGGNPVREYVMRQDVARQLPFRMPFSGEQSGPVASAPPQRTGIRVKKSLTVNKSPEEMYRFWRQLENLPRFMSHVQEVHQLDERRSHWHVRVLKGIELEWDAQITVDRPNEMIAWETLPGARVFNRGYVKFIPAPRDHGTEVHVSMEYQPPLGALGQAAAGAFNFITERQVKEDIRNFKQIMEAGEIPTTDGQPSGRK